MSRDGSAALATFTVPMSAALALGEPEVPAFEDVYAAHVAFVWRIARAFGVADEALEDVVQEVFVVVHRKLPEFEARAAITTWLFAITRRIALAQGRRGSRRKTEPLADEPAGGADTFAAVSRAQAAAIVAEILDDMDEEKRIVLALVELEQLSVPEVARMLEINVNTAYSRLRLARKAFEAALAARRAPCLDERSEERPR